MRKDLLVKIPEMVKDHAAELKAFDHVVMGPFAQDTEGWTDPETNEFYPPTMDFGSYLRASRISDKVDFAVRIRLDHKMLEGPATPQMADYVGAVIKNAIFMLAYFSKCTCTAEKSCGRPGHRSWKEDGIW
jgi:hypothetical protein